MSEECLALKSVSKSFRQTSGTLQVLSDVNLSVRRGEFVAILGYSGSGKTTLMSILAGLHTPDRGEVLLNGKPVREPGPDRGVVFQNYSLLPWLTVAGNISLAVEQIFPKETKSQHQERVAKAIATVNLSHASTRRPAELSGGMRQRVAIARALAMNPEVLLMDEPLSALDALTRGSLQDEFERLWRTERKTVVMITNNLDEAILLADRIIPLTCGPGATLGPSMIVDLPRPRDRKAMNHDPKFIAMRAELTKFLLDSRRKPAASQAAPARPAPVAMPKPISLPPRTKRRRVLTAASTT